MIIPAVAGLITEVSFMIKIYFGNPGSGKTTLACRIFKKVIKNPKRYRYKHLYCNFECSLADQIDLKNLGEWSPPPDSLLIIDEAGIEYNSRKFKSLTQSTISWLKLHRHYKVDVFVISQSWEDMDITIRRLASELWYIRRLGPFTSLHRIYKTCIVDDLSHQIVDGYKFGKILHCILPPPFHRDNFQIFFRRSYYKYFDSFSRLTLPEMSVVRFSNKDVIRKLNKKSRLL